MHECVIVSDRPVLVFSRMSGTGGIGKGEGNFELVGPGLMGTHGYASAGLSLLPRRASASITISL